MQLARFVPSNVTLYASLPECVGKLQFFPSPLLIINYYIQRMCPCDGQQVQHFVETAKKVQIILFTSMLDPSFQPSQKWIEEKKIL